MEKLNGLDLFSGIGGITLALTEWVKPIVYCELDSYARGVLLSRMLDGKLPKAPIWDDVTTLRGENVPRVDIIYGGFPCQDISVAGTGKGLEGKRSGLFSEIVRLAQEIKPTFLFLENVPAIRTRGLDRVIQELTQAGYDCRWTMLSAADVGANHKRERWFLLAKSNRLGWNDGSDHREGRSVSVYQERNNSTLLQDRQKSKSDVGSLGEVLADTEREGLEGRVQSNQSSNIGERPQRWWDVEPNVGRVAHGVSSRVDRLKCLGNAVVPLQAKEAFKILLGLK